MIQTSSVSGDDSDGSGRHQPTSLGCNSTARSQDTVKLTRSPPVQITGVEPPGLAMWLSLIRCRRKRRKKKRKWSTGRCHYRSLLAAMQKRVADRRSCDVEPDSSSGEDRGRHSNLRSERSTSRQKMTPPPDGHRKYSTQSAVKVGPSKSTSSPLMITSDVRSTSTASWRSRDEGCHRYFTDIRCYEYGSTTK